METHLDVSTKICSQQQQHICPAGINNLQMWYEDSNRYIVRLKENLKEERETLKERASRRVKGQLVSQCDSLPDNLLQIPDRWGHPNFGGWKNLQKLSRNINKET